MKYIITTAIFTTLLFTAFAAKDGELSKEKKKEIKATLKEYKKNPQAYLSLLDNQKKEVADLEAKLKTQKMDIEDANKRTANAESGIAYYKQAYDSLKTNPVKCPECPKPGAIPATGDAYKVQIGLYEKFDITPALSEPKYVSAENIEGYNRYLIGHFDTEEAATGFMNDLRKLGIRNAFIAKYTNGTRIMEWGKNPKFKNKPEPASIREAQKVK